MTTEDIKNIQVGDTLKWTPDLRELDGFKHSNQYKRMIEKDIASYQFDIIENTKGFTNFPEIKMSFIKYDGTYVSTFDWLYDEEQQKDLLENQEDFTEWDKKGLQKMIDEVYTEVFSDMEFITYLMKVGLKYFVKF